jgi:3-polyprenyl-4-hydroxybenzoate decarboxylase
MPKKKNNNNANVGNYRVLTGGWYESVQINHDIFDDPYIEACTQVIEQKVRSLQADDDLHVNPVMLCKSLDNLSHKERYINTYKVLLNAGMPARAELLRDTFMENINVDLAMEPISSSFTKNK